MERVLCIVMSISRVSECVCVCVCVCVCQGIRTASRLVERLGRGGGVGVKSEIVSYSVMSDTL